MAPSKRRSTVEDPPQPATKRQRATPGDPVKLPKPPTASRRSRKNVKPAEESVPASASSDALPRPTSSSGPPSDQTPEKRQKIVVLKFRRPAPHGSSQQAKPKAPNLPSMPIEVQLQIFLCTTARETASIRRVCKNLNEVVLGNAMHLATKFASDELARLQCHVDEFESLKTPTDADSLMKALHVWTKRRGQFTRSTARDTSGYTLMAHFFKTDRRNHSLQHNAQQRRLAESWASVASWVTRRSIDRPKNADSKQDFSNLAAKGVLDDGEVNKLLEYADQSKSQRSDHQLCGPVWPQETPEYMTLPGPWKLSSLLHRPASFGVPEVLKGDIFDEGLLGKDDDCLEEMHSALKKILPAKLGSQRMISDLGLPVIADSVSCYYVKDEWARDHIRTLVERSENVRRRQKKKVQLKPLLRAAFLESVMMF